MSTMDPIEDPFVVPSFREGMPEAELPSPGQSALAAAPRIFDVAPWALDPRLQRLLARHRQGQVEPASTDLHYDEVAVVARVTDVEAWEALSEVRSGAATPSVEGEWIVTGRIPIARVEHVRRQPMVRSLKAARPMRPALQETVSELEARAQDLPSGVRPEGGRGVVIGVVDYGCDFAHHNFRTADGETRLRCIWNQDGPTSAESPFGYGRRYARDDIDAALKGSDPYAILGYGPAKDSPGRPPGTHGTHVMDIACGNGLGSGTPGVAPQAEIVFVDLTRTPAPLSGSEVVGTSFGHSVQLVDAIQFIFDEAGDAPCVVNLSLGTNGGPHDGSTLVERFIDAAVRARSNRAVVVAAGNAHEDRVHLAGRVGQSQVLDIRWSLPTGGFTHDELEIWYPGDDAFSVELLDPSGFPVLFAAPDSNATLVQPGGTEVVVFAANRRNDPNNGANEIGVFLEAGAPPGVWTVRLHGEFVSDGRFHAWVERDDLSQSSLEGGTPDHTLGSISCGHESIVVGSFDAHKKERTLSWFSGAGPTSDRRQKPEVSAPGHNVLAAHSRTGTGVVAKSGTSMAAPAVAGVVGLLFAEAARLGEDLSSGEIRTILVNSVRRSPPVGSGWDARYGEGRVSAALALDALARFLAARSGGVPAAGPGPAAGSVPAP